MTQQHQVVQHDEWVEARKSLLAREKEFTRERDRLSKERRDLPWERVDKEYVFEGPDGEQSLAELFDGRSQLVVYHFMFAPGDAWDEACKHCSFWADNFDPIVVHLNANDVTMVAVSRAALANIERYRGRMGWSFKWLSSSGSDFNFDYGVSFTPDDFESPVFNYGTIVPGFGDREGVSVFTKVDDEIFHTYSTYARGLDLLIGAYNYLDLTPLGRQEADLPYGMAWVKHHDKYER
jgi:predicted dithiol-disulfide oxidoreductase (DUF899 family)